MWLSIIPFVIGDNGDIIRSIVARTNFLNNVYLLLSVVAIVWQTPAPTDADLQHYDTTVMRWRQHFLNHYIDTSKTRGCFDNFHKVTHAAAQARRDGGFQTTCTSSHEQSHVPFAKRPARRHNRKGDVERRMLSLVQKSDQLDDANKRLEPSAARADDSTSRGSTASGSVTRVNLRTGYMLYIYHKLPFIQLPSCCTPTVVLRELRKAYVAEQEADSAEQQQRPPQSRYDYSPDCHLFPYYQPLCAVRQ